MNRVPVDHAVAPVDRPDAFSELNRTLGASLRASRQARGLSLRDLAVRTGISSGAIRTYESGERPINIGRFLEICHTLGVDPLEMLGGLEWKSPQLDRVHRVEPGVYRINLAALGESDEVGLVPLKRWVLSQPHLRRSPDDNRTVLLDRKVIPLLAEVLNLSVPDCIDLLRSVSTSNPRQLYGT